MPTDQESENDTTECRYDDPDGDREGCDNHDGHTCIVCNEEWCCDCWYSDACHPNCSAHRKSFSPAPTREGDREQRVRRLAMCMARGFHREESFLIADLLEAEASHLQAKHAALVKAARGVDAYYGSEDDKDLPPHILNLRVALKATK